MSHVEVFHGTSVAFEEEIRAKGLPGAETGVRVRLTRSEAIVDARAWCATLMVNRSIYPAQGLIIGATIDRDRVRDVKGVLRVEGGLGNQELSSKRVQFTEFDGYPFKHDQEKLTSAMDHFKAICSPSLRPFRPASKVRGS